jgi:hypothetical protein
MAIDNDRSFRTTWRLVRNQWDSAVNGSLVTTLSVIATGLLGISTFAVSQFTNGTASFPLWPAFVVGSWTLLWVCISLPIAAVVVVHRERMALLDSQAALATEQSRNSRDLAGEIVSFRAGGSSEALPGRTMAILEVVIRNRSPHVPTTAEDYSLTFIRPNGTSRVYAAEHLPVAVSVAGTFGDVEEFDASEFIYNKTAPDPIPAGGFRAGRLFFPIPEADREFLEDGTRAHIEFSDINKTRYASPDWLLGVWRQPQPLRYQPGTNTIKRQTGQSGTTG